MGWLSAIASLAGTVASGIGSAIGNAAEDKRIKRERGASNHFYNQQIQQDATERADFRKQMYEMERLLKKNREANAGRNAIMGGMDENAAAQGMADASAVGDVMSAQAAEQAKRNDLLIEKQHEAQIGYDKQKQDLENRRMESWENLASNVEKSFSGLEGKIDKSDGTNNDDKKPKDDGLIGNLIDGKSNMA